MTESHEKRILFVDDEESLALLGKDLLEDLGYLVTCAFSAEQALELFRDAQDAFELVITDETMPGMSGIELAQELYRDAPEVPVILCSGHMLTMQENGMEQTNIRKVMAKTDVCVQLPALLEQFFPGD